MEALSDLPKVMQLMNGIVEIWMRAVSSADEEHEHSWEGV